MIETHPAGKCRRQSRGVMSGREKTVMSWSGGKDSALALRLLLEQDDREIVSLLTTVTGDYDRIAMHGVRRSLLEAQAAALGLPLKVVILPARCDDMTYRAVMAGAMREVLEQGVTAVAFGDIHLEDVRRYREDNLRPLGIDTLFPLWGKSAGELARLFLQGKYRAVVTCVDTENLDGVFCGRDIDENFLNSLPPGADPFGEKGEYHSFVYDGPLFRNPVPFVRGKTVLRDGRFLYCDLQSPED